jgi:flagellar hook-length control protein FliK
MPAVSPGLSNPVQADSTSPSPVPAVFVSDASADDSRVANFDKRHEEGSPAETLISPATTPSAVSDVAPTAVHAAAPVVLQPNPGFESAPGKTPASLPQQPASVAHEKAFAAWQSASDQVGRIVNSAALNSLRNGTEMRVQLRTDAYGPMEIRATLDAGKVGAAIGVENAQAHHALLNQLPALQQSLSERQVQVDHISVVNSFAQNGSDFGAGSGKQHDDASASGASPQQPWGSERVSEPASLPATEVRQPESLWGRLNVRA